LILPPSRDYDHDEDFAKKEADMPELAAVYFIGLMVGLVCTATFVFYLKRRQKKSAYIILQYNLRKVGLFWSDNQDRLINWSHEVEMAEQADAGRSITLTGILLSAFSWPGVLFFLIVIFSVLVLARSRSEKRIFSSDLSKSELDAQAVRSVVSSLLPEIKALPGEQTV
jgi:hypothetical protein